MENQHPIEGLMRTTLESIKNMVDVNTILGDPVETPDGKVIIPISRVTFGFAAGGTEYELSESGGERSKDRSSGGGGSTGGQSQQESKELPFGGGSGAGISIQPVGFLIVGRDEMRLLPVDGQVVYDRLLDMAPKLLDGLQGLVSGRDKPGAGERAAGAREQESAAREESERSGQDRRRVQAQVHRYSRSSEEYPS